MINERHQQKRRDGLRYLLALPRSIYYNLRLLPFRQARRLPLLISHRTVVRHLSAEVVLPDEKIRTGLVKIGFATFQGSDFGRERTLVDLRGRLVVGGECAFGAGCCVEVAEGAELRVGERFHLGPRSLLICHRAMTFGRSVRISWNCTLMDTDQHRMVDADGKVCNSDRPLLMGDNVWVGCHVIATKGVQLADNTTVSAGARLTGRYDEPCTVLAGNPATVVRHNVKRDS